MYDIDGDLIKAWIDKKQAHLDGLLAQHAGDEKKTSYVEGAKKVLSLLEGDFENLALIMPTARTDMQAMALSTTTKVRVRAYGAQTSFDAATSISPKKALAYYRLIYRYLLDYGPLTHEDLIDLLKADGYTISESGIRARAAELKMSGWIKDSGLKGKTKAGHPAIKWRAVPEVVTTPIPQYRDGQNANLTKAS